MNEQLVRLFSDDRGSFISGERISQTLGCSRTAVWKHIQQLRREGYRFEAVPRRGYRLIGEPDKIGVTSLLSLLTTKRFGRSIRLLDETESTQNVAHEWVKNGAAEGAIVLAEAQTAGRGRMGKGWHSPKGQGIWMSLVLMPPIPLPYAPQLTLLVAVALCRTIRQQTGLAAGIKWPNDLLIDGRKLSGILLESRAEDERLQYVIAGVGISVNIEESGYPEHLRSIATSLFRETGRSWNRGELLGAFLAELECLYELYLTQGFAPIRTLWEALTVSLGRSIRVHTAEGSIEGFAESIDDWGALHVRLENGTYKKVYSGDLEHQTGAFD